MDKHSKMCCDSFICVIHYMTHSDELFVNVVASEDAMEKHSKM